jgi:murein DD-endopeptidase MepM/ murein hydrolase activator NlpD
MQILITHSSLARSRVLHFNRLQMAAALAALIVVLSLLSGTVYHFVFLKAAREGWPVVSHLVKFVVRDEFAQRDRYLRENVDAMAQKVGEMQAKLIKLEAQGDRVSTLVGVKPEEIKSLLPSSGKLSALKAGQGGPFVPVNTPSFEQLNSVIAGLDQRSDQRSDLFTMIESRLFEKRMRSLMVPNGRPIEAPVGSGFGFRSDPFTGRAALHTGLDFAAESGTRINAAAGGVVLPLEVHPSYGNLVEIDHGQGLLTRYAHTSKVLVKAGDIVKRGQPIAEVGTTGRSTGPHLHFEVMVEGVHQDPAKFLAAGEAESQASLLDGALASTSVGKRKRSSR